FAGQEDPNVTRALGAGLLPGVADRLPHIAGSGLLIVVLVDAGLLDQRSVPDLDRVGTAAHLYDRDVPAQNPREVLSEPVGIDGGRGDDELELRAPPQQLAQDA